MKELFVPKYEMKVKVLIRDKDGHPKIDDPSKIELFKQSLTEDDIIYLKEKFGNDYIYTDD